MALKFHPDALERYHLGFRYEDLEAAGILDTPNIIRCNLTNDIHPLIAPENFTIATGFESVTRENFSKRKHVDKGKLIPMPQDAIERMRPALQLASKFITHPVFAAFWCKISNYPATSNDKFYWEAEITPKQLQERDELFKETLRCSLGPIQFFPLDQTWNPNVIGKCTCVPVGIKRKGHVIRLDSDAFAPLLDQKLWEALPVAQRTVVQFHFAIALTHELAHAAFNTSCNGSGHRDSEPVEMGYEWETFAFTGRIDDVIHSNWLLTIHESKRLGRTRQRALLVELRTKVKDDNIVGTTTALPMLSVFGLKRPNYFAIPISQLERYFTEEWWANPTRDVLDNVDMIRAPQAEYPCLLAGQHTRLCVESERRYLIAWMEERQWAKDDAKRASFVNRVDRFLGRDFNPWAIEEFEEVPEGVPFWSNLAPSSTTAVEAKEIAKAPGCCGFRALWLLRVTKLIRRHKGCRKSTN